MQSYETGIVICEASKPKKIIALGCSTEELHAVPKELLRFPNVTERLWSLHVLSALQ